MAKYTLKRIVYMALTLLIVTSITFFLLYAIPGDLGQSLRYPGRKVAALNADRWPDRAVMVLALLGTTIPTFVIASVLQYALTVTWPIFPTTGYSSPRYLVLPVLCMCAGPYLQTCR